MARIATITYSFQLIIICLLLTSLCCYQISLNVESLVLNGLPNGIGYYFACARAWRGTLLGDQINQPDHRTAPGKRGHTRWSWTWPMGMVENSKATQWWQLLRGGKLAWLQSVHWYCKYFVQETNDSRFCEWPFYSKVPMLPKQSASCAVWLV